MQKVGCRVNARCHANTSKNTCRRNSKIAGEQSEQANMLCDADAPLQLLDMGQGIALGIPVSKSCWRPTPDIHAMNPRHQDTLKNFVLATAVVDHCIHTQMRQYSKASRIIQGMQGLEHEMQCN